MELKSSLGRSYVQIEYSLKDKNNNNYFYFLFNARWPRGKNKPMLKFLQAAVALAILIL